MTYALRTLVNKERGDINDNQLFGSYYSVGSKYHMWGRVLREPTDLSSDVEGVSV